MAVRRDTRRVLVARWRRKCILCGLTTWNKRFSSASARIGSGSQNEIHEDEEAQPHCEPDQSESSDDATEREESWESCEAGWQAVEEPLTLQRVSSQPEQRERVTVEICESRPRTCRMAPRWVSKEWLKATRSWPKRDWQQRRKTSLTRLCCKGREIMTAWRSLPRTRWSTTLLKVTRTGWST